MVLRRIGRSDIVARGSQWAERGHGSLPPRSPVRVRSRLFNSIYGDPIMTHRHPVRARASRWASIAQGALLVACVAWPCAFAQTRCDPLTLRAGDLREILGEVLGDLKPMAESYDADVVPVDRACYVHMRITTRQLLGLPGCTLKACSVAVVEGQQIALREFDVSGCNVLFEALGIRRKVPTAFTSAAQRITGHCGSGAFDLQDATPMVVDGTPAVVLQLAPRR